jgi:hypothetical protein
MTSTRGSQGSSGTTSLDMEFRLTVALNIVGSDLSQILWKTKDWGSQLWVSQLHRLAHSTELKIAKFVGNNAFYDEFSEPYTQA